MNLGSNIKNTEQITWHSSWGIKMQIVKKQYGYLGGLGQIAGQFQLGAPKN